MLESKNPDSVRFPLLTLLLVVGSLLVFLLPAAASHLFYEREQILAGEWWRLVTGVVVHFSWSHLIYNSTILLIVGWLLERENRTAFIGLVLATTLLSGLYFLFFLPEMKSFAGLSAIVSAVVVYLCLINIENMPQTRWLWIAILILFVSKVIYEGVMQQAFFVSYTSLTIRVVPSAHIIGAMVAIAMVGRSFISKLKIIKPGSESN